MTANDPKLYHSAASPNSRRIRIFLAEKGLTVPLVPVDLGKGERHTGLPRYQSASQVPTLVCRMAARSVTRVRHPQLKSPHLKGGYHVRTRRTEAQTVKIQGPDHPISVERNASRVVVTVAGRIVGRYAGGVDALRGELTLLSNTSRARTWT